MITISAALREREIGEEGMGGGEGVGWVGGEEEGMEESPLRVLSPVEFALSLGIYFILFYFILFFFFFFLFLIFFFIIIRK